MPLNISTLPGGTSGLLTILKYSVPHLFLIVLRYSQRWPSTSNEAQLVAAL